MEKRMGLLQEIKRGFDRKRIDKNCQIWNSKKIKKVLSKYCDNIHLQWEDSKYRVTDKKTFEKVLNNSIVDDLNYESEFFDCDNFASLFRDLVAIKYHLNSIGNVISYDSKHSFNIVVTTKLSNTDSDVWVLEPQSMKIWPIEENTNMNRYKIKGQIIRI